MATIKSPENAYTRFMDGGDITTFSLGLDLTLKALQMCLDREETVSIPVILEGIRQVDSGYTLYFKSTDNTEYAIGAVSANSPSLLEGILAGRKLADQITDLRRKNQ